MSEVNGQPAAPEAAPDAAESQQENKEQLDAAVPEAADAQEAASPQQEAEQKAQAAALKKLFKLKIDGKEIEQELDFNDEESVKKHLQMSLAAQKRMQEAAEYRKQIESELQQFFDVLKNQPDRVLKELGVDPEEFANNVINRKLEDMKKSPEQRQLEELQKELENERKAKKELEEGKKKEELARLQAKAQAEIEESISSALEKGQLIKSPIAVKKVAEYMIAATEFGINVSPDDIIPLVKSEIEEDIKEYVNLIPDEALEKVFGEAIKRVRKRSIIKSKAPETASSIKPTGASDVKPKLPPSKEEKMSMRDFFKGLK